MGVGMPAALLLNEFGLLCQAAFDTHNVYHVGSSIFEKTWRDVDVRCLLEDEVWDAMGLGAGEIETHDNARWVAFCLAFSSLGKQMTGLPIDFQLQRISEANEKYPGNRSHLGSRPG